MILDDRAGRRHDQPYVTVFLSDSHVDLQMLDDGVSPDAFAGDHLYVAHLEFEEAQAVEVLMLEGAPSPLGDVFSQSSRQLVEGRNRWKVDSEEQLGPADELLDEAAPLEFEISLEEAARRVLELAEHLARIVAKAQDFGGVKPLSGAVISAMKAKHLKAGLAAPALKV